MNKVAFLMGWGRQLILMSSLVVSSHWQFFRHPIGKTQIYEKNFLVTLIAIPVMQFHSGKPGKYFL